MWMSSAPLRGLLLVAAMSLAVATFVACGDGDGSDTPATATATATTVGPTPHGTVPSSPTPAPTIDRRTPTPTPPPDGTVSPGTVADTAAKSLSAGGEQGDPFQPFMTDLRLSVHPESGGWERIVFEFRGPGRPPVEVSYVDGPVYECGRGLEVEIPGGGAALVVRFEPAAAHDWEGQVTFDGRSEPALEGGTAILGGQQFCDFEGVLSWVFGIDGTRPFALSALGDPVRVVIDIKP